MPFTRQDWLDVAKDPRATPEERAAALKQVSTSFMEPAKPPLKRGIDLKAAGSDIGRAVEFGGGLIPNPLIRLPAVAAGGALSEISEGGGLKDVGMRVGSQLALEAALPGLGKFGKTVSPLLSGLKNMLPRAALHMGTRVGGLRGKQAGQAVDAFMRDRERSAIGKAIVPGGAGRLAGKQAEKGAALEAAEKVAPDMVNVPVVTASALRKVKPELYGRSGLEAAQQEATQSAKTFAKDYPKPVTMREAGKIKRAQASEATELIKRRAGQTPAGKRTPPPYAPDELMSAKRAELVRDEMGKLSPEIAGINKQLSDLHIIDEAMAKMRGGGGIIGDLGGMAVRGGLGYGAGRALSNVFGAEDPHSIGEKAGIALGPGLNPRLLAYMGYGGGRLAPAIPSLIRLLQLSQREKGEE